MAREFTQLLINGNVTGPVVREALKESSRGVVRRILIDWYKRIADNSSNGAMKENAKFKLRILDKNYKNCDLSKLVEERYYSGNALTPFEFMLYYLSSFPIRKKTHKRIIVIGKLYER